MKRIFVILAVIVVLIIIVPFVAPFIFRFGEYTVIPHGYDGVIATTLEVEHDYSEFTDYNTGFAMGIDPVGDVWGNDPTGLRVSTTSPQYVRSADRILDPITDLFTDAAGVVWDQTTEQKVSKMTFEMTITLTTYGAGLHAIKDVAFWISLASNDFSVFTGADDVAIAVLEVYNMERPFIAQNGASLDFEPEAGGAGFPLHSTSGGVISTFPDWAADSYNLENLQLLSTIKFPLYVLEAAPNIVSLIDYTRVECQVEFTLGIDVLVFGEWRELKPYREVEPPDPDLTWWEMLLESLGAGLEVIYMIVFVLVGIIGTALALLKLKQYAIPAIVVLWAGIVFLLWWLGVF